MKKNFLLKTFIAVLILALALTACNLTDYFGGDNTEDFAQIETIAAATISARFTQSAYETMVAQLTQVVPTSTAGGSVVIVTNTPQPMNTPIATFTPAVPSFTPVPPTKTPVPIPCNAAAFVDDVTVKDWSTIYAGESFVKTWKVKNVGTCSWTKEYKIFFFGGNQMSAPSAVAFPEVVDPGESVNLSVTMVAPSSKGEYSGSWMLKAANGTVFGVGSAYNVPLSVNIKVDKLPAAKVPDTVYDLVANYCDASWRTNGGDISCPSSKIDTTNGSITRSYAPVLAGGYKDDEGAIYTVPAKGGDGMIQGNSPRSKLKMATASAVCSSAPTKPRNAPLLMSSFTPKRARILVDRWDHGM
jgi:predicted small secreted protein